MARLQFAIIAAICFLTTSAAAKDHESTKVPDKVCSKNQGYSLFTIKKDAFAADERMASEMLKKIIGSIAPEIKAELKKKGKRGPSDTATVTVTFGTEATRVLDGCLKSIIKKNVVQYAIYKYSAVIQFKDSNEVDGDLAYYFKTNIAAKVYRRGNFEITDYKWQDVTNYE